MRSIGVVWVVLFLVGCAGGTKGSGDSGASEKGTDPPLTAAKREIVPDQKERTRPVTWSLAADQGLSGSPGETVTLRLLVAVAPNVRLYSDREYPGMEFSPVPTTVAVAPEKIVASVGRMTAEEGGTIQKVDPHFGEQELEYWVGTVNVDVPVTIAADATAGKTYDGSVTIEYMSCNDKVCYPPTEATLPIKIAVTR